MRFSEIEAESRGPPTTWSIARYQRNPDPAAGGGFVPGKDHEVGHLQLRVLRMNSNILGGEAFKLISLEVRHWTHISQ